MLLNRITWSLIRSYNVLGRAGCHLSDQCVLPININSSCRYTHCSRLVWFFSFPICSQHLTKEVYGNVEQWWENRLYSCGWLLRWTAGRNISLCELDLLIYDVSSLFPIPYVSSQILSFGLFPSFERFAGDQHLVVILGHIRNFRRVLVPLVPRFRKVFFSFRTSYIRIGTAILLNWFY